MAKRRTKKSAPAGPSTEVASDAALDAVLAQVNRKFGDDTFMKMDGNQRIHNLARQISTGSVGLDSIVGPMRRLADGRWQTGLAPGRIVEIYGPEMAGKSTMCMTMAANDQQQGGRVAYIDMEHALDPPYCAQLGLDLSKVYTCQPDSGDQAMELVDMLIKSRSFTLIIVDSVAALVPQAELDGEVTDKGFCDLPSSGSLVGSGKHGRIKARSMPLVGDCLMASLGVQ